MKKIALLILSVISGISLSAQETQTVYLTGHGSSDPVEWDFFCSAGANSGKWTKIGVPSVWECQGFGQYTYGHMPLKERLGEQGIYRRSFTVPAEWKGKRVDIVFGGVMTDALVTINGKTAGEKHQGGHYEFRYDISRLLKYGTRNRIEVRVDKLSSNESLVRAESQADFWVFGGIFRPVFLEARPAVNIENFGIDAKADGSIFVEVQTSGSSGECRICAQVKTIDGKNIGTPFEAQTGKGGRSELRSVIDGIEPWSDEFPRMYRLELSLLENGRAVHRTSGRFGFRTVEVRPSDGIYVNGVKMKFKGVDRHSFHPSTGRTLNDSINLKDALLIKEMNMNAVRCSHYPPEKRFLDICDSLGLYVIDELTGWQDAVDTAAGRKLIREMVLRDRNHPCVLLWANGNEGGFNFGLDGDYGKWDTQRRSVIHPWLEDEVINAFHYPSYDSMKDYLAKGRKIWMPTEFNHGLYDGGHGAGLDGLWKIMWNSPLCAGGFLWDLIDQAIERRDLGGKPDTDGNHGADGILGPNREKEGSFFAIREIWSPVQFLTGGYLPGGFDGRIAVENRYSFTNLASCRFSAELKRIEFLSGNSESRMLDVPAPSVEPGMKGFLNVAVPSDWAGYDVLEISAFGPDGRKICSRTLNIGSAKEYAERILASDKSGRNVSACPAWNFRLVGETGKDSRLSVKDIDGGWKEIEWELKSRGYCDNAGVTFDFPEDGVESVRWLGNGPYRVWKNRMQGVGFGLWKKDYNDTATGESWDYPEFKGYHSNMYAADIITKNGVLRMVFASDDLFLRLFTPAKQKHRNNDNTLGIFPDGQISVLNAISAVGTKFKKAAQTGPDGGKNYIEYHKKRSTTHASGKFYIKYTSR